MGTQTDPEWFARTYAVLGELFQPADMQACYQKAFADCAAIQPMDGMTITGSRAAAEQVCRFGSAFSAQEIVSQGNVRPLIPLSIDPPEHTRYRKLLDKLFRPALVDSIEDRIYFKANELIDQFIDRGRADYTAEFALRFPSAIFLEVMGLPEDDLEIMMDLKEGIFHPGGGDLTDPAQFAQLQREGGQRIYDYFNAALDERQVRPRKDVLTGFLQATIDERPVTREEILDMAFLLVLGGLDTVTASLTCFMAYLAGHPDKRKELLDDPSLIPAACEELMRWESSAPFAFRQATEAGVVEGCPVKPGDMVYVALGAANLDPAEFDRPTEVDFTRFPNRHVGYGIGNHRCLGSHLARRELKIALEEWHRRIPDYRVAPGVDLDYVLPIRHVSNLELVW